SLSCLVQDPRDGYQNIWYYGTGEGIGNSASGPGYAFFLGDGIFKSTDSGLSWTQLASTVSNTPELYDSYFDIVFNLAVNPINGEVYAATAVGIARSSDGGESWVAALEAEGYLDTGNDVAVNSDGIIYAAIAQGDQQGLWRSEDGQNWEEITPAGWPEETVRVVIDIAPSDENIVYFLANSGSGTGPDYHALWRYNHGIGWENWSANIPDEANAGEFAFDTQAGYDMLVKAKPNNADVVFLGGVNLYRIGATAVTQVIGGYLSLEDVNEVTLNYDYPNHHPDQHALVFLPSDPDVMFSGHDGGISFTADNLAEEVQWEFRNSGYVTTQFYTIAIDYASDSQIVSGGLQDRGNWFHDGSSTIWPEVSGGDGATCAIADNRAVYYFGIQNGITFRRIIADDGTISGDSYPTRIDPAGAEGQLFTTPYVLDSNNSNIMYYAAGSYVWRNNDLPGIPDNTNFEPTDVNWTRMENTMVPVEGYVPTITALAVSTTPTNRLFVGNDFSRILRFDYADSGDPMHTALFVHPQFEIDLDIYPYVNCIAVNPENGDELVAVFSNYGTPSIFHSVVGGISWLDVSGNLEEYIDGSGSGPSVRSVTILPLEDGTVYFVATSAGLYSATELIAYNTVWVQEGAEEIGNVVSVDVKSRPSDGWVVAATHGQGIFSAYVPLTAVEDGGDGAVSGFRIDQNHPNPFTNTTVIAYSLPQPVDVSLKIYDAAGRLTKTLVAARQQPGDYSLTWNGKNEQGLEAAAGVYFYNFAAGDFHEQRKMTLIR
ncbi:MAG: T9SS type A sorting domain-containing protein, partial [Planctomycetes bacterium]|nr:T9SS type A sorting domain-containing protein [Planctomycetota bacterium]